MAEYPIPPWIHGITPAQVGGLYQTGLRTGASIQEASNRLVMEQQRMDQEKELAQMRLQAVLKEQEAENARKMQMATMQKAYQDQVIDLRKQQVAEGQQKINLAAQVAASKFAAGQEYQRRVAAGEDPGKVILELGPAIGGMGSEMGAALRGREGMKQYGPVKIEDLGGGFRGAYREGSPGLHVMAPTKAHELTASGLASLAKAIPDLQDAAKRPGGDLARKILQRVEPMLNEAGGGSPGKTPGSVREVMRNPKTGKFELVPLKASDSEASPPASEGEDDEW